MLLWWQAGGARLSASASREIARAETVLVSPVSCWEVAALVERGRVELDRGPEVWVRDLFADRRLDVASLSPEAAVAAARLPRPDFLGDPADRLIYATAGDLRVPLVTKDEAITAFARQDATVRTVW